MMDQIIDIFYEIIHNDNLPWHLWLLQTRHSW